jgi:glycosyltransferase involved in cell wall biosynthesis
MRVCLIENVNLTTQLAMSNFLVDMAQHLSEKIERVDVICLKSQDKAEFNSAKFTIHEIGGSTYSPTGNLRFCLNAYRKLMDLGHIDIIHILHPNLAPNISSLFYNKLAKGKSKIVIDRRSDWISMGIDKGLLPKTLIPIAKTLLVSSERYFSEIADANLFIKGVKRRYAALFPLPSEKTFTVHNAVDTNRFRPVANESKEEIIVGYVGTLQRMRDFSFISHAFKKIEDQNIKLYLAGSPAPKNLPENIIYLGNIPYAEMPKILSKFDIGLSHLPHLPAFSIGGGEALKILEYLACGIPIVASKVPHHYETDGFVGALYEPTDCEDFIQKLLLLAENEGLREELAKKGRKNALEIYSWSKAIPNLLRIYQSILD